MAKIKQKKTKRETVVVDPQDRFLDYLTDGQHTKNLKKYAGVTIAEHYKGETIKNKFGMCYKISTTTKLDTVRPKQDLVRRKLLSDLKAIPGIAKATEINLKREGFTSVVELKGHYRFGTVATTYYNHIEARDGIKIYEQLSSRFTSTNPLLLSNSAYFDLSEITFIDIETLGFADCPLFLIGFATFQENNLIIEQIFLRELKEEKSALHFLAEHLNGKKAICSFNGKSFDVPFIRKRMMRHDLKHSISLPHFDIKYFCTKAFSRLVSDFRLQTLEYNLFSTSRTEDIPSGFVPDFYKSYIRTKNIGAIIPIISHNQQDLITTAKIFMKLHEKWS